MDLRNRLDSPLPQPQGIVHINEGASGVLGYCLGSSLNVLRFLDNIPGGFFPF